MIIVRDIFTAKPGMAGKLARQLKEAAAIWPQKTRVLTDLVGYTHLWTEGRREILEVLP